MWAAGVRRKHALRSAAAAGIDARMQSVPFCRRLNTGHAHLQVMKLTMAFQGPQTARCMPRCYRLHSLPSMQLPAQVMKMVMALQAPTDGTVHFKMLEGSLLTAGDLVARLDLDDPVSAQVCGFLWPSGSFSQLPSPGALPQAPEAPSEVAQLCWLASSNGVRCLRAARRLPAALQLRACAATHAAASSP